MPTDVRVTAKPDFSEGEMTITGPHGGEFRLMLGDKVFATHPTPKPLSTYAFAHGAYAIRHDYDLRLGE